MSSFLHWPTRVSDFISYHSFYTWMTMRAPATWLSYLKFNRPSSVPPRGLCTCSSLGLLSVKIFTGLLLSLHLDLSTNPRQRCLPQPPYLKSPPPSDNYHFQSPYAALFLVLATVNWPYIIYSSSISHIRIKPHENRNSILAAVSLATIIQPGKYWLLDIHLLFVKWMTCSWVMKNIPSSLQIT